MSFGRFVLKDESARRFAAISITGIVVVVVGWLLIPRLALHSTGSARSPFSVLLFPVEDMSPYMRFHAIKARRAVLDLALQDLQGLGGVALLLALSPLLVIRIQWWLSRQATSSSE